MNLLSLTGELRRLEALTALARARAAEAAGVGAAGELVFRPGAPDAPPIYGSWASLYAAISRLPPGIPSSVADALDRLAAHVGPVP